MTAETDDPERKQAEEEFFIGLEGRQKSTNSYTGVNSAKLNLSDLSDSTTFIHTKPIPVNLNSDNGYRISVWVTDDNGATNMRVGEIETAPEAQENPNYNLNTPLLSTEAIIGPEGQIRGDQVKLNFLSIFNFLKKKKKQEPNPFMQLPNQQTLGINDIHLIAAFFDAEGNGLGQHDELRSVDDVTNQQQLVITQTDIDNLNIPAYLKEVYMVVSIAKTGQEVVWFDDLVIEELDDIVQENHYYAFGMNMTGIEKQGAPDHKFQFQGQEKQDEFGLNWTSFDLRNLDVQLGRWHSVDPYSQHNSPYISMGNNPIIRVDPDGGFDWIKNEETNQNVWDEDVTSEEDTPDGFSYVGASIKDVYKDFGDNAAWYDFWSEADIDFNNWGGEVLEYEPDFWQRQEEGNFLQQALYRTADGVYLFGQTFNPFDTNDTHLSGEVAVGDDKTDAFVETVGNTIPFKANFVTGFTWIPKKWVGERVVFGASKLTLLSSTIYTKLLRRLGLQETVNPPMKTMFGPAKNTGKAAGRWAGLFGGTGTVGTEIGRSLDKSKD